MAARASPSTRARSTPKMNDRIVRYALPKDGIVPTGAAGDHRFGAAAHRRPSHASIRHRRARAICSSMSRRPPIPASRRIACRTCPATSLARSSRRAAASGATTRTRPGRCSRRRSATPPASATPTASPSMPPASASTPPSTAAISCYENWPKLYSAEQGANLPAEELLRVEQGADYGWPSVTTTMSKQKLVLAPEYGGDGGKDRRRLRRQEGADRCVSRPLGAERSPLYDGSAIPRRLYSGGAFIAFHGSWNRAPSPQGGYNVVFQPLADGKASGNYVVFADGFAGASQGSRRAAHRPSGVAVGPDGALYVSDDQSGRIWRVTFHGDNDGWQSSRLRRRPGGSAASSGPPGAAA